MLVSTISYSFQVLTSVWWHNCPPSFCSFAGQIQSATLTSPSATSPRVGSSWSFVQMLFQRQPRILGPSALVRRVSAMPALRSIELYPDCKFYFHLFLNLWFVNVFFNRIESCWLIIFLLSLVFAACVKEETSPTITARVESPFMALDSKMRTSNWSTPGLESWVWWVNER